MDIGEKIKNLRLAEGLTQDELAKRADLTKGFISLLERDLQSPSLDTLELILNALDTTPAEFFEEEGREVVVFSRKQRVTIEDEEGVRREVLIAGAQDREVDMLMVTIAPGSATEPERSHRGDECGVVLSGKLTINLGKEVYTAQMGDAFYYTAGKKHFLENKSDKPAKILWISAPPSF